MTSRKEFSMNTDIVYEPMAVTETGNIPLHEARARLSAGVSL